MTMGQQTQLIDRIKMIELAQAGQRDGNIAKELGWSPWTVRKWRRRQRDQGRAGLHSHMGRPKQGTLSTYRAELRETLLSWRQQHPGWGAKTLLAELAADDRFARQKLPSLRSINRFLQAHQLVQPNEPHVSLPQSVSALAQATHEEGEIDGRGHEYIPDVGVVELIDLNDCYSHIRLLSYPCVLGQQRLSRRATTEDYQLVLRLAFTEWGLPNRLTSDHHRLFYEPKSKSPFPTRLHLWLTALGICLNFGRFSQPTDQAITERSHQLWDRQVLQGQVFADWHDLFGHLQQRRHFLNSQLPCVTLGEVPPLLAHPEALTNPRLYRPEWEIELLDAARIHAYLAQGQWFRRVSAVGTFSLGGYVYGLGRPWANVQVQITFDPADVQFVVQADDGHLIKRFFPSGLSPDELLGEMSPLTHLPAFQLALPFSWQDWRRARLSGTLMGTT
jgi:transposase-like protein